jgi:hypothetical protein
MCEQSTLHSSSASTFARISSSLISPATWSGVGRAPPIAFDGDHLPVDQMHVRMTRRQFERDGRIVHVPQDQVGLAAQRGKEGVVLLAHELADTSTNLLFAACGAVADHSPGLLETLIGAQAHDLRDRFG